MTTRPNFGIYYACKSRLSLRAVNLWAQAWPLRGEGPVDMAFREADISPRRQVARHFTLTCPCGAQTKKFDLQRFFALDSVGGHGLNCMLTSKPWRKRTGDLNMKWSFPWPQLLRSTCGASPNVTWVHIDRGSESARSKSLCLSGFEFPLNIRESQCLLNEELISSTE